MADSARRFGKRGGRHHAIHVALVETSPVGTKGSMTRYADLVEQAFSEECRGTRVRVDRVKLARNLDRIAAFPARLRNWLHHAAVARAAAAHLRQVNPDLFHIVDGSHAYIRRWLPHRPVVVTAHDVIPLLQSLGRFGRPPGMLARWLIGRSIRGLRRADHIIADSENTADDLCQAAGIDAAKVTVVYPAVVPTGAGDAAPGRTSPWLQRRNAKDAYVLHVGNNAFYKNRLGVLRIFQRASASCGVCLRMAGPAPGRDLLVGLSRLGIEDRVRFVIDPDDAELAALYRAACLFVFPSLYEGFGWPPLEAMAFGCPVVCSSAGSLPEVVGDAALSCSADDEEAMAVRCMDVLDGPSLAEELIERGCRRAAHFSLERVARGLLEVYRAVLRR